MTFGGDHGFCTVECDGAELHPPVCTEGYEGPGAPGCAFKAGSGRSYCGIFCGDLLQLPPDCPQGLVCGDYVDGEGMTGQDGQTDLCMPE